MAHITGIKPGFVPVPSDDYVEQRRALLEHQLKAPKDPQEIICACCGGQIGFNTSRKKFRSPCRFCDLHFGISDARYRTTSDSYEQAVAGLAKIREQGYVMLLRSGHFAVHAGGSIEVQAGDIFQVDSAGDPELHAVKAACSYDRTKQLFSVRIKVGPYELVQWTHEVSAIPFKTVMDLRRAGQIVEQFVSDKDSTGHWAPTPEMRAEITAVFGDI